MIVATVVFLQIYLKKLTYRLIMKRNKVKLYNYDRIIFYIDEKNKVLIQK